MNLEEVVLPKFWLQMRESMKRTQRSLLDLGGVADIDLSDPFGQEQFSYPSSVALQRITDSKIILSSTLFVWKWKDPPQDHFATLFMVNTPGKHIHIWQYKHPPKWAELRVGDSLSATNLTSTMLVRPLICQLFWRSRIETARTASTARIKI